MPGMNRNASVTAPPSSPAPISVGCAPNVFATGPVSAYDTGTSAVEMNQSKLETRPMSRAGTSRCFVVIHTMRPALSSALNRKQNAIACLALFVALGGVGYAAQSGLYFSALARLDAGLVGLLLYTFPAFVTIGAVALGRDRLDAVRVGSIVVAFAGLVLVLFAGEPGELDPLGLACALGAPLVYTVYILASDTVLPATEPRTLAALVCTGGAITFTAAALVSGDFDTSFDAIGWLWIAAIVVVSTVLAIVCFFAGLGLVGPSRASIISTVEPVVTVVLAMIVFGEELAPTQLLGGALVLGSVVLLQTLGRPSAA